MPVGSEFSSVFQKIQTRCGSRTFVALPKSASIKRIIEAMRMDLENLARCPESTPAGLLLKSRLLAQ